MINVKFLTTKEVARLCRVSDATVKRWELAGLLNSERTNGGHRRFRAQEVARFQQGNNLGTKICHGDESAQTAVIRRRVKKKFSNYALFPQKSSASLFFPAILAGREEEAANILINDFLHGEPLTRIFDETIAGTMCVIGELWVSGELTVAQEHLATRSVLNAVHKLRGIIPVATPNGKTAMCCAIEGDFHELITHLVQIMLESDGWEVFNFGANTPLYSFAEEILHYSPDLICISATILSDIERLARDYKEFQAKIAKLKIPVLVGGRVFDDSRLRYRFPADFYAKTFAGSLDFARSITDLTRI